MESKGNQVRLSDSLDDLDKLVQLFGCELNAVFQEKRKTCPEGN